MTGPSAISVIDYRSENILPNLMDDCLVIAVFHGIQQEGGFIKIKVYRNSSKSRQYIPIYNWGTT